MTVTVVKAVLHLKDVGQTLKVTAAKLKVKPKALPSHAF
jgi:hypothetical protein